MDPKEGDYVRFKHKSVEITGTVIKRSGTHVRVQPKDGGAALWKELSELLPLAPAVDEASEIEELQRLFSSGLSSARGNAFSTRGVQAAAKQTISERPNKIGMPTPVPKPLTPKLRQALTELVDIDPEVKRELSALDSDLADVLGRGDIALVSAKWLKAQLARQPDYRIVRRQDLKPVGGIKPHLTPTEAKRLLLEGRRAVGAFSLGWPIQGNPDPTGHRIQAFGGALQDCPDIEAFFWDYPSLYQNSDHSPRTDEQELAFKRGLRVVRRSRSERSSGTPHVLPLLSLHALLCTASLRECHPPPLASAPCVRPRRR